MDDICKVCFDANGGTGLMPDFVFKYGVWTQLPRCLYKRDGFLFGGWSWKRNGDSVWQDKSYIKSPPRRKDMHVTLYAVWRRPRCIVRFDANGGCGTMEDVDFIYGTSYKLPANSFRKRKCEFVGWSWHPSGDVVWPDEGYIRQPPVKNDITTLYAKWMRPPCRKLRVLHLFSDWWICARGAEFFTNQVTDDYFVLLRPFEELGQEFKVLKNEHGIHEVGYFTPEYYSLMRPDRWDIVWLHGVWLEKARFAMAIKKADPNVKIMWSTWGFDYLRYGCQWLFGFKSTFLYFRIAPLQVVLKKTFMWVAYFLKLVKFIPHDFVRFLRIVDYYNVTVPTEKRFLQNLVGKRAKSLEFHYISEKREITNYNLVSLDSKNVLIGNCSRPICNHFDVFPLLKNEKYNYDFWIPLSYGYEGLGTDLYGRFIAKFGFKELGSHCHPMLELMPLAEYLRVIQSCSVFIFAHRRVAALGNVQMAIKRGGCVFMNPANPLYKHLRQIGVIVYPLSRIKDGIKAVVEEFRPHQKENTKKFWKHWNYEVRWGAMYKTLATLYNDVLRDHKERHYHDLWRVDIISSEGNIKVISCSRQVKYKYISHKGNVHELQTVNIYGYGVGNIIDFRPSISGKVTIVLSGVDRYTADGTRQKVLTRFKSLVVNGDEQLNEQAVTWACNKKSIAIEGEKGCRIQLKIDADTVVGMKCR